LPKHGKQAGQSIPHRQQDEREDRGGCEGREGTAHDSAATARRSGERRRLRTRHDHGRCLPNFPRELGRELFHRLFRSRVHFAGGQGRRPLGVHFGVDRHVRAHHSLNWKFFVWSWWSIDITKIESIKQRD